MPATSSQETQGLLSPWLRARRLQAIAPRILPGSIVLDLACGTGALRHLLPEGCAYYGIDRLAPAGSEWCPTSNGLESRFMRADLTSAGAPEAISAWMNARPNLITATAFVEHLKEPAQILSCFIPLLGRDGRVLGTTPHPRGHWVHDTLAVLGLCSKDGAREHETFLGRVTLADLARQCGLRMSHYRPFLLGLNQVFEFRRGGALSPHAA